MKKKMLEGVKKMLGGWMDARQKLSFMLDCSLLACYGIVDYR